MLVNESAMRELGMERWLKQGDPPLFFLFHIAVEGLNFVMNKAMEVDNFEALKLF